MKICLLIVFDFLFCQKLQIDEQLKLDTQQSRQSPSYAGVALKGVQPLDPN